MTQQAIESLTYNIGYLTSGPHGSGSASEEPLQDINGLVVSSFGFADAPLTNPTLQLGIDPARLAASLAALGLSVSRRRRELTSPERTTNASFDPVLQRVGERNREILERLRDL